MQPYSTPNQTPTQDPVIKVWTKGRLYPWIYGIGTLLFTAGYTFVMVKARAMVPGNIVFIAILTFLAALAIANGFRRKLTITQHTVVLRQVFNTKVIPLRDITRIYEQRRSTGSNMFTRSSVKISTIPTGFGQFDTMSFGAHNYEGMNMLADAAIAVGARIIDRNVTRETYHPTGQ